MSHGVSSQFPTCESQDGGASLWCPFARVERHSTLSPRRAGEAGSARGRAAVTLSPRSAVKGCPGGPPEGWERVPGRAPPGQASGQTPGLGARSARGEARPSTGSRPSPRALAPPPRPAAHSPAHGLVGQLLHAVELLLHGGGGGRAQPAGRGADGLRLLHRFPAGGGDSPAWARPRASLPAAPPAGPGLRGEAQQPGLRTSCFRPPRRKPARRKSNLPEVRRVRVLQVSLTPPSVARAASTDGFFPPSFSSIIHTTIIRTFWP